jgi:hypothetical protein
MRDHCRVAQQRLLLKCLSRVRGNSHARFLGGKRGASPLPYPVHSLSFTSDISIIISECNTCYRAARANSGVRDIRKKGLTYTFQNDDPGAESRTRVAYLWFSGSARRSRSRCASIPPYSLPSVGLLGDGNGHASCAGIKDHYLCGSIAFVLTIVERIDHFNNPITCLKA